MKKLRVGVIGPIYLNIPPNGYGGTEDVVLNIVNGLTELGHDVTLFGPGTSKVKSKLVSTIDIPLREQDISWFNGPYTQYHIEKAFDMADQFDIIHMHLNQDQDSVALPFALRSNTPVVFTLHYQLPTPEKRYDVYQLLQKYKHFPYISISDSQRRGMDLNFIATIHNSLRVNEFDFSEKTEDYFVWLGKINPLKGTKEAMLAALKAKVKLYVMGAIDKGEPVLHRYYEKEIKPMFDYKYLHWMGQVNVERKVKFLKHAKAFLNPIQWEEPFGLVMIESQACGTPVISYKRGAASEVIIDKKTGFLVDTFRDLVGKMKHVGELNRHACRKNIEKRFTVDTMVDKYLSAYEKTITIWSDILKKQREVINNYKL